jgi:DnaJ domain
MPPFLIALIIVAGGFWVLRKAGRTPPAEMRLLVQKLGGGVMIAFAATLILSGRWEVAIGLFAVGMGLIGKASLLPNGFGWNKMSAGPQPQESPQSAAQRGKVRLPPDEALAILGLKKGASAEEIKQAHKRLMKDFHPDLGGTDYLAAKINEAKDVLLS